MAAKSKTKRKAKAKLTAEQKRDRKIKNDHIKHVRNLYRNLGFSRVTEIAGTEIEIAGQKGEFDDAFIYENLILLVEYTTSSTSNISDHLKHKKIIFSNVISDQKGFIEYFKAKSSAFKQRIEESVYHIDRFILKIVYCSLNQFDEDVKKVVTETTYLDYPELRYFEKVASIIKLSALPEMLEFLKIDPSAVARNGIFPKDQSESYHGSILPESASGFPPGYKVVSFYADAAAILGRAYVLRRDGWRGSNQAYQRMIQGPKIEDIRKKLRGDRRTFVNNLIATLSSDVHPETEDKRTVDIKTITKTEPVIIKLPQRPNSIGLIDGQHRLYSYYESKDDDPKIAVLRNQQNLLITGIIYPPDVSVSDVQRFEANLFLSINSNQTNAANSLKQEIEVFLNPFSPIAIGRQVMQRLSRTGPLVGEVEMNFYDKGKLKTTSIVSYGLGPLLKLSGNDSLFKAFKHEDKAKIADGTSDVALESYISFAVTTINTFFGAVKANVSSHRWTTNSKITDRLIAVTYINSFLITLRHLIENDHTLDFTSLNAALNGLDTFDFKSYHSSQYGRMAQKIYDTYFASPAGPTASAQVSSDEISD